MSETRKPKWVKAPWCAVEDVTLAFVCGRCGARFCPRVPIRLSAYLKYADAFQEEHELCKAEAPQ